MQKRSSIARAVAEGAQFRHIDAVFGNPVVPVFGYEGAAVGKAANRYTPGSFQGDRVDGSDLAAIKYIVPPMACNTHKGPVKRRHYRCPCRTREARHICNDTAFREVEHDLRTGMRMRYEPPVGNGIDALVVEAFGAAGQRYVRNALEQRPLANAAID